VCGLVYATANDDFSVADAYVGARLGFYGVAKIVPGARM
jgi:hypothetical protein